MKSKKGISHVEMMLSFVIFIGFVFFLFSIFHPFETDNGEDNSLGPLQNEIMSRVSTKVIFQTLSLDKKEGCFKIKDYLENSGIQKNNKIVVKNKDEEVVESESKNNNLVVGRNESDFFYITASSIFEEKGEECKNTKFIAPSNYTLGLWRSYTMVSNKSLHELKETYRNNYSLLREELKLPSSEDFGFTIRNQSREIMIDATKDKPQVEVYAKSKPIQIVYKSGKIRYAVLGTQVW